MQQIINLEARPKTDKCVLCGEDTGILKDTPVDMRWFYVEGSGQLCPACFKRKFT